MTYILLAAGPEENVPSLNLIKERYQPSKWIGVDRGVYHLLLQGIVPNMAFGDFDSLAKEERELVNKNSIDLKVFPVEKDATDLEIAIDWALTQSVDRVIILGATGGRMDHMLMNVQLLQKGLGSNVNISIEDKWNRITVKEPGEYSIKKSSYKYISFLPITSEVVGLSLSGFRYSLSNADLQQASSLCISNELMESVGRYSFFEGRLLVMESKDSSKHV